MSQQMTPEQVASMVADAEKAERDAVGTLSYLATVVRLRDVRALAAECERLRDEVTKQFDLATMFRRAPDCAYDKCERAADVCSVCARAEADRLRAELANAEERVRANTSALRHQIENWTKVRDASFAQTETLERYRGALERIANGETCCSVPSLVSFNQPECADIALEALEVKR